MKKSVQYAFRAPARRVARLFWLSVWLNALAPTLCNVSSFGNVGILSLLSLLPLTVGLNQFHAVAIAAEGRQWEYDPYTHQLQITSQQKPQYFILADPPRIAIDVPNSNFGINPTEENYPGLVRRIRISQFKPGETRIVMDLDPGISIHPGQITLEPLGQGNRWVLRPQFALSQVLPRMENTGTLPQLPAIANIGHQPPVGSQPENAIVPPLEMTPVPISSDVGLPTQQVTPGTTSIFVPPPPPPGWENQNNQNQNNQNQNATDRSSTIPPSALQTSSVNDFSELTPSEKELMESLPPYSEWQQVPLSETPSATIEESASVTPAISATEAESTEAETATVLSVPAVPEWETATAEESTDESTSQSLSLMAYSSPSDGVIIFGESLPVRSWTGAADADNSVNSVNSAIDVPNLPNDQNDGNASSDRNATEGQFNNSLPITDPNVLVAAGTVMILRYPGSEGFTLKSGSSRREVLVVDVEVYDRNGNAIAPVGTPAIGTFISDRSGSRFVVEAMAIDGEMVPISAASDAIAGDMAVSRNGLLSWSTLGAVGGAAIGGLAGGPLLGGAAAGLAANLLSAPKQTAIAPGQVLPVRFTEHWRFNQP